MQVSGIVLQVCVAAVVSCAPAPPTEIASCGPVTQAFVSSHACYRLGEGEFRSVLWPVAEGKAFTLVLQDGSRDHSFEIVAPRTGVSWGTDVLDATPVTVAPNARDPSMDIHTLRFRDGRTLGLSLPRGSQYMFQVHDLRPGGGGVTFMNLEEGSKQRGVFGFASWRLLK